MGSVRLTLVATLVATLGLVAGAPTASAITYAPIDQPGPPLTPSADQLASSLQCGQDVADATREPVLLLPATTVNSRQDFGYNLERSLGAAGIPYCTSDMPGALGTNMDDIQLRGEYVTYAIRSMFKLAGRPIAVMGHSQGGSVMRWSLRFWPDTRAMVADVIGIAGSNHGSETVAAQCLAGCSASFLQQQTGSAFEDAMNSRQETFAGIDYTEIISAIDEVVTPNGVNGASAVHGPGRITNVTVQSICPLDHSEHLQLAGSPVTWALALDALTHDGPADPARIDPSVCNQLFPPGVDPTTYPTDLLAAAVGLATQIATYPHAAAEPKLRCYVTATCPATPATAARCTTRRHFVIAVLGHSAIRSVSVLVNGRKHAYQRTGSRGIKLNLSARKAGLAVVRIRARLANGHVSTGVHRFQLCD